MTTPVSCSNATPTSKPNAAMPCALSFTYSAATKPYSTCGRGDQADEVPVASLPGLAHHETTLTRPEGSHPMQSLSPNLPPDTQREMLRRMLTIRRFEER